MQIKDRKLIIEEIVMKQSYLMGLQFRLYYVPNNPRITFRIEFVKMAQWQMNQVRQKFLELKMNHIEIIAKEVTLEPKPRIRIRKTRRR